VQLRHVPTETSFQDRVDHGYIAIFDEGGKQLVRRDGFQHNANLRNGGAYDNAAIDQVVAEVLEALKAAEKQGKLPSFIESSFTTKAEYEHWLQQKQASEVTAGAPAA